MGILIEMPLCLNYIRIIRKQATVILPALAVCGSSEKQAKGKEPELSPLYQLVYYVDTAYTIYGVGTAYPAVVMFAIA
jgi:hypothetical protein